MNKNLSNIGQLIDLSGLSAMEKQALLKELSGAEKQMNILEFKLQRTEEVKKTTGVLLEETIEELEQKRKAVEEKNRDLEIESALERVRTVAMGMRLAEDLLNICKILFEELTALGFGELRNAMINIVNDEKGSFLNYDFNGNDASVTPFLYNSHPVMERQVAMTRSASDAFFEHVLTGDDLEDFKAFRVRNGEPADPKLENVSTLYYYFYSIGVGSIGISAFSSLPEEKREVLKRFRNVFDLAYRRYADIQLAETQAREAQIELALERVRARTMAMQHSEELAETAFILFQQFKELGENPDQATIGIINESEHVIEYWVTMYGSQINKVFKFSIDEPNVTNKIYKGWRAKKKSLVIDLSGKALTNFATYRQSMGGAKFNPKEKRRVINVAFFSKGLINVQSNEERSEESIRLLERFAGVFEGTYTRFLDLKKSEAQARESQIELGLERVRARTMAMQHSEELAETAFILFQQFKELGENPDQATIGIINEQEHVIEYWVTMYGSLINKVFKFSIDEPDVTNKIYKGWKAKKKSLVIDLSGKALTDFATYRESMGGARLNKGEKRRVINVAFFSKGLINVQSNEERSEESIRLLERFAAVFEGTYTRFLDLKKAEAQARESQIELALERVRARTMAMQHSSELKDAASELFLQVEALGVNSWTSGFQLWDDDRKSVTVWTCTAGVMQQAFKLPATDDRDTFMMNILQAEQSGETLYIEKLDGKSLEDHYAYMATLPGLSDNFASLSTAGIALPLSQVNYAAFFTYGYLLFITYEPVPEAHDIFKRFAKVFEQTYTRFLDLKKAEAQSRESQIELALERVRARTMAMQHTNELGDAALLLFQQVFDLGIRTWATGFNIWNKGNRSYVDWVAGPWGGFLEPYIVYLEEHPLAAIGEARRSGSDFFVHEMVGNDIAENYRLISGFVGKENIERMQATGLQFPARQINHYVFGAQVSLMFITFDPCLEAWDIFKRFGKVFEQTYTRFLDLQKAEAQVREAKIEAALEKVRSRSLAMHLSAELLEVVTVVFEKLQELEVPATSAGIQIFAEGSKDMDVYVCGQVENESGLTSYRLPYFDHRIGQDMVGGREKGLDFLVKTYSKEEKNSFYNYLFEHSALKDLPREIKSVILQSQSYTLSMAYSKNSMITINDFEGKILSEKEADIIKRFSKVFEQAYVRFLDLQKAEAQVREAQIEAALERTRTQSMIMQHSSELDDTLRVFHQQVLLLSIRSAFSFLWLPDEGRDRHIFWAAWAENNSNDFRSKAIDYPLDRKEPATAQCLIDWKGKEPVVSYHVPPAGVAGYFAAWQELIDGVEQLKPDYFKGGLYYVEAFMKYGCFGMIVENSLSPDETKILGRFAIEFERTYTRFLDLQKAEAQAREAQIELSLERVRASAMAMHKTDQLLDAAELLYRELTSLGVNSMAITYAIMAGDEKSAAYYSINPVDGKINPVPFDAPHTETEVMRSILSSWKKRETFSKLVLNEEATLRHQTYIAGILQIYFNEHTFDYNFSVEAFLAVSPKKAVIYTFNFAQGYIFIIGSEHLTKPQEEMVMRFTKVFEMTYRRFLDLKQAEEQARESQIQLGLERVRAKAMAMQTSEELNELIGTVFGELTKLDFVLTRCLIMIFDPETKASRWWMANSEAPAEPMNYLVQNHKNPAYDAYLEAWKDRHLKWRYTLKGKVKRDWDDFLFVDTELAQLPAPVIAGMKAPEQVLLSASFNNFGCLTLVTLEPLSDEHSDIMLRFAKVFDMCYTRFNDLKQAEEQAKESQIQLALERVRARTMAMQQSIELAETASLVSQQLHDLGLSFDRVGFYIWKRDTNLVEGWTSNGTFDELLPPLLLPYVEDDGHRGIYEAAQRNEHSFEQVLDGDELKRHYEWLLSQPSVWGTLKTTGDNAFVPMPIQFKYAGIFKQGYLMLMAIEPQPEAANLLERFAQVFEQTYTRFQDLQRAEAQARDAVKQASVDRVRAEIASMRSTKDLERIIPLVWNELTILNVPFIRCGVFIVDDDEQVIHTHLSTPDGQALAVFNLPFEAEGIVENVLPAWRKNQVATAHWTAEEFAANTKGLVDQGVVKSKERFVTEHPDTSLDLHFFPFLQGMLYVGNVEPLSQDAMDLGQSLAGAFSTAYARYEDFNKLELAKQQVDKTLTDLKAAQTQLIQTEKMASLGELTAGIAHEIQNPLNFVNNFSEVNAELIEEMQEEIEKGDLDEIKAIAIDILENSKKISMHGKRADGIVKGMLQHSQSGSGIKELTSINSVADEYMRLAYHGLRAKDKFFNAEMTTHFDAGLPKIKAIGQDIGRVMLNLFTNAFYAVNKKRQMSVAGYKPEITVSTSTQNGQVLISVKDNGIGMPDDIKDKIMQPFFTTKPTGEGTGLGLSLTYDMVVKGHGGSIDVNSVDGEGSEFIISIPIS